MNRYSPGNVAWGFSKHGMCDTARYDVTVLQHTMSRCCNNRRGTIERPAYWRVRASLTRGSGALLTRAGASSLGVGFGRRPRLHVTMVQHCA